MRRKRYKHTTSSRTTKSHTTSLHGSRRRKRSTSQKKTINVDTIIEKITDEAISSLGLDVLGLTRDQYREMLRPIIEGILSTYSSRPAVDTIISKMRATLNQLYMMAAAYVLEKLDELNEEQLEFVIANGATVAVNHIAKLYKHIEKYRRWDLLPQLRYLWETYGKPTPLSCPYCGFRAITPDLVCLVCGREIKENDLKKAIDFEQRLIEFAETTELSKLREIIEKGYVLIGEDIRSPSEEHTGVEVELRLSEPEKEIIRNIMVKRGLGRRDQK